MERDWTDARDVVRGMWLSLQVDQPDDYIFASGKTHKVQEVVEGVVDQITEYGAFVRFGPLDGLLHVSQVQDDHINTDVGNQRLVGKETKRELRVGDKVRARIVTISINEISPRESKIGLTMRQPGLGKHEWIAEDQNKAAAGGE